MIVFAQNYSIGIFEELKVVNAAEDTPDAVQPKPTMINLLGFVDEDVFSPDPSVIQNALTRNLRIEKVYFDSGWHIVLRARGNKRFDLQKLSGKWVLVSI